MKTVCGWPSYNSWRALLFEKMCPIFIQSFIYLLCFMLFKHSRRAAYIYTSEMSFIRMRIYLAHTRKWIISLERAMYPIFYNFHISNIQFCIVFGSLISHFKCKKKIITIRAGTIEIASHWAVFPFFPRLLFILIFAFILSYPEALYVCDLCICICVLYVYTQTCHIWANRRGRHFCILRKHAFAIEHCLFDSGKSV